MITLPPATIQSLKPRLVITAVIVLALTACATRTSRSSLGSQWEAKEPVVDLNAYESIQKRPGQRSDVAVAVAISGGGMRAANFAAGVLKALEATPVTGADGQPSNLLREVDYFSTVSGGGMAAGSFMTSLMQYRREHPEDAAATGFSFSKGDRDAEAGEGRNWRAPLAKNYQSSLVGSFFNPLMAGDLDRGDILEGRLDDNVLGQHEGRSLTLGDIFVPKGTTPRVPFWITNGTIYENGAIFPFTPDILTKYNITGYKHRMRSRKLESVMDLPLAVGLKCSASFPVAIPPTTLKSSRDPDHPSLHLLDGGVADNLGILTAIRLLRQDSASRKVLIVIDAYNGKVEPYSRTGNRPGMMLTALRTTTISLASAHQRVHNLLDVATAHSSIQHAVIDFHKAVQKYDEEELEEPTQLEDAAGVSAMKEDETSPQSVQAVFTQALGVGTSFTIDDKTQQVLIKAGENAVFQNNTKPGASKRQYLPEIQRIRRLF